MNNIKHHPQLWKNTNETQELKENSVVDLVPDEDREKGEEERETDDGGRRWERKPSSGGWCRWGGHHLILSVNYSWCNDREQSNDDECQWVDILTRHWWLLQKLEEKLKKLKSDVCMNEGFECDLLRQGAGQGRCIRI